MPTTIGALTQKSPPADGDFLEIEDTETDPNTAKKVTVNDLRNEPGGNDGELQFNSGGSSFGGATGFEYDSATRNVTLFPEDVASDGGTNNSPIFTLRAKHDSDDTASVVSASTDYTVEFVSQVASGAQDGHVAHSVGGTESFRVNHDGELDVQGTLHATGTTTLTGDVTLQQATAAFVIGGRGDSLTWEKQGSGNACIQELFTTDGDGTDDLRVDFFAVGTVGDVSTRERLQVGYISGGPEYVMRTATSGGSHHPIKIESGGNTDQFVAATDGKVGIDSAPDEGTFHVKNSDSGASSGNDLNTIVAEANGNAGMQILTPAASFARFGYATENGNNQGGLRFSESNNEHIVYTNFSGGDVVFRTGTFDEVGRFKSNSALEITAPNTATGTTLVVSANDSTQQEIQRDSSTLRHKENVTPITTDDVEPSDVLAIDPIYYTRDGNPEVGFGAEHFDFGPLSDGLAYDGEDRVAGFLAGSRVIDAAQHVVLQDHDARIEDTEDRVEQLEAEVEVLRDTLEEHDILVPEAAA